ncbi:hypothetical protein ACOSQ3_021533 [Xanthoceras sorbifolium]
MRRFSYDRLKEEKIQHCFLYYSLHPEYHNIPKTELVNCWIAEGLVQEMDNLQAIKDRAHIMIKILVNNLLLLESIDYLDRSRVKLHDVARDMVLRYITSKSPLFTVKVGLHLKDIQESFLSQMNGLMILNLSETKIESLPNSISKLTSCWLHFLINNDPPSLPIFTYFSKLLALRILDLEFTEINVPTGMDMLTNLTSLDLFSMELHKIPAGIFLKLCRLQTLVVHWGFETPRVAVDEAVRLQNLDCVIAQFLLIDRYCDDVTNISDIPTFNTLERLEILLICHYVAEFEVKKLVSSKRLLQLKNIYSSNGVMVCDSLQEIVIWDCPQLKRLSLYLPVDEKGQPSPPPAL